MILGLRIGLRYVTAGKSQTALMMILVMIGVTAYTFITAVVVGVQSSVIDQSLGSASHITLEPFDRLPQVLSSSKAEFVTVQTGQQREKRITDYKGIVERLEKNPKLVAVSPIVSGGGIVARGSQSRPVTITGGYTESIEKILRARKDLESGEFRLELGWAVIGKGLAGRLGVGVGDRVKVSSESGVTADFKISGILYKGTPNVDEQAVYVKLEDGQRLLKRTGNITAIETKVEDVFTAESIASSLNEGPDIDVKPWNRENTQIQTLITSQNLATGVIRAFALLSVAFGVASVLNVTVAQKSKEVGILKGMGATTSTILIAFVSLGAMIGLLGGIFGATLSYLCMTAFKAVSAAAPKGSPSLSMDFRPEYIWQAIMVSFVVAMLGAILPARKASRLDPVEAIRSV